MSKYRGRLKTYLVRLKQPSMDEDVAIIIAAAVIIT